MGKKSVGQDKYESKKDKENAVNSLNDTGNVNDMLDDGQQLNSKGGKNNTGKHSVSDCNGTPNEATSLEARGGVDDEEKKGKKQKKRKLEAALKEKFPEDGKKDKRANYGGDVGDEERKEKNHKKRKLGVDLKEQFQEDGKDERAKDDGESGGMGNKKSNRKLNRKKDKKTKDEAEASEICNEKDERKDRKKKKKDRDGAEATEVEKVSKDIRMAGVEKAQKNGTTPDDADVSLVGCEEKKSKKKKERMKNKDENNVEPSGVQEAASDTHAKKADKATKKVKRTKSDTEANGVSEVLKDGQSGVKTTDLQTSDTEEKNRKKKKKKSSDRCGNEDNNFIEADAHMKSDRSKEVNDDHVGDSKKGKKKKKDKSIKKSSDGKILKVPRNDSPKSSIGKETPKKVSFSDQVEIFPSLDGLIDEENAYEDGPSDVNNVGKDGFVHAKWFSPEEDEILRNAVRDYIEQRNLGEEGIDMILHCKGRKEVRNCWKDIAANLPWRPVESVYYRVHILFERDDSRKWTEDEYELIRKFHEKHGSDWRTLADALGKHRFHVKDTWRRIKLENVKKGHWSQDEYQGLFDLVNTDLRLKAFAEKKSKHGMLRDNICWSAISDKLATRHNAICCKKWYTQLTSSMVAEGIWADTDDYRMLAALQELDACSMEDVDWDNLIEHRTGEICRKRWNQMVNHLGHLGTKSFGEQVEVLSERYCLDVLEPKEAYDSRTPIDL